MSTQKYRSYKDVPIPWIASIPEHWDWKPVLGAASERDENNKGMKEDNLLSLSYGNIVNKDINTSDGLLPESFETYQIVRPGDIVLRLTDLQNDKRSLRSALVTQTGVITSAYLALKPKSIDPKYLGFLLRAYDVSKVFYSMGGGLRQSMKYGDIKRMPLVIPTKAEQSQIATFLDRETAKIDTLIGEQQRLIELLQEKRQAVISHAVTKGLNPNAPMKDSGVEWLGEVPENWDVVQVRRITKSHKQSYYSNEGYSEQGINLLRITDIKNDTSIDASESPKVDENSVPNEFLLEEGDFVFARTGGAGSYGFVRELDSPTAFASYLIRFRFADFIELGFLRLYFLSKLFLEGIASSIHGGVNQNVHAEDIKNQWLSLAPQEEQRAIARQVFSELDRYAILGSIIEDQIRLLNERRSALISAAVTGQIDVRGLTEEVAT